MGRVDIFSATYDGSAEGVKRELASGVDPNAVVKGQSALMIACERGHPSICEILLCNGAKVNAVDRYGRTALYQAVVFNQPGCAKVLVQHGASTEARSWLGGESPADIAKLRSNVELQRALATPLLQLTQRQDSSSSVGARSASPSSPTMSTNQSGQLPNTVPVVRPSEVPIAMSLPRRPPAPEVDESQRREPLISGSNVV
jgi:hypothetical protein